MYAAYDYNLMTKLRNNIIMFTTNRPGRATLVQDAFRWFYSFLLLFIIPFAFANLVFRGVKRSQHYNQRRFERFGFVRRPQKQGGYLIHCVSVGEVVSASCLVKKLMLQEPRVQITITTTTPTGSARVRDIFGDSVHHFYLPYDLHSAMAGMIKRVKPKAIMITEVELWPNLIHAAWKRDIPIMVINARMTDRSAKRYAKVPILFSPMLKKLSHVCAQGKRDFDNYLKLGIDKRKLVLTNNIKFDQASSSSSENFSTGFKGLVKGQRPIIVAGSTHDPEESVMLKAFADLIAARPKTLLIIVPRHPERFDVVAKLISKTGLRWEKSTDINEVQLDTQVLLVNEMGKLNQAYTVGNMAFVGGSIADRGGHNALEPAAASLPIMMGKHTYNNPVICQYLQQRGALEVVENNECIFHKMVAWLDSPDSAIKAGKAGFTVLKENQGAMDKTLLCLRSVLKK